MTSRGARAEPTIEHASPAIRQRRIEFNNGMQRTALRAAADAERYTAQGSIASGAGSMRKEYDFSRRVRRNPYAARLAAHSRSHPGDRVAEGEPRLTRAQTQELDRRLKDLHDRTRYLLVSALGPRFALYYNVSEDAYGMNEPAYATLFKRRAAALAIKRLLSSDVKIARCRVDPRGRLVLNSLAARRRKRRPSQKAARRFGG